MSRKKKQARDLRAEMLRLCGEIHEEDGQHPRDWYHTKRSTVGLERKTQQLCRQVARTLELVLGDCDDPIVQSAQVLNVTPNPDSSCLRVHVAVDTDIDPMHARAALTGQISRLKFEIARSIHRKRVPNLVFHLAPHSEQHDE